MDNQQTMDLTISDGNAVSVHQENIAPVDPFLSIIERALFSPEADISKLERVIALRDEGIAKQAKAEFVAAFSAMQQVLPSVVKKGKGGHNNKFITFDDAISAVKPVLSKYEFALNFKTSRDREKGVVTVTAILRHAGGYEEESSLDLPVDTSGSKNAVQAIGSTVSYGKRYTAFCLLNIAAEGEDDDAQRVSQKQSVQTISEEQAADLLALIEETKADQNGFLVNYKIKSLSDLPLERFKDAVGLLEKKRQKNKERRENQINGGSNGTAH